ncbi:MAG: HAD family phosphatase [Proteobacteria bacterium]|jgi:putative hydrolase of the HAD superfamily|nr:HAD family phosphatase [Pseudomonadota bacterium]MCG6935964.1 HAD family phosphatase [Pseudomonadota bacterium]
MATAIKAVLFDFGGVLAEEGFRNGLQALAREQGLDVYGMPRAAMQAVYESGFVLGRGSAADFWALLRQRTGLQGDDATLSQRILDGFVIRPEMISLVRQLRSAGYLTGILSDQTRWLDALDRKYHFYAAFDQIYNSCYLGKGKQDPSLFDDVSADLGLPNGAILFVDDDTGNAARARKTGMQAIVFSDQAQLISVLQDRLPGFCFRPGGGQSTPHGVGETA